MVRDGRAPLDLSQAIGLMMTERDLVAPAGGGSVLAQWETVLTAAASELVGHVGAAGLDEGSGRLDVVPDVPARGVEARWIALKRIAAVNEAVPDASVRAVRVLGSVRSGPLALSVLLMNTSLGGAVKFLA
ncbi:hypothetical protein [Streptomyces sp. NPDC012825]|uniref:hypothetical protein n=1 Tax=Streptomyces sp. NPDC012825 TaxID=3364851 RepID=UPI0036808872